MRSGTLIGRLIRDESGSAITEMVMGLPIFIMIFSGMGMLYRLNHEALVVKAQGYAKMWEDDAKTSYSLTPAAAVLDIGGMGDLVQNGLSAGGLYVDSGIKAGIPAKFLGGGVSPKISLSGITGGNDTMINYRLLNDFYNPTFKGGSWAQVLSSFLQTTGSGLGVGAGIRYGASQGEASRSVSTRWGSETYESGEIDVPQRTAATHRVAPVILTRMEFGLTDRFDESIPVFDLKINFDSENVSDDDPCSAQAQSYSDCVSAAGANDATDACKDQMPSDSCADMASDALGKFDVSFEGGIGSGF